MEFVSHQWINPNTIEKRMYQENIVRKALTANTLCVIPTGMGKTSIAALVVADMLSKDHNKKILFLAPTKPLVDQHRKSFIKYFKIGEDELKTITGEDKPEERKKLYEKAEIIFSTPQTIQNDLKKGVLALNNFSLVIFDEAHRAIGNYAYPYVANVYVNQCTNPLILALTASPGGFRYKVEEVRDKLFIKNVEIRSRDDVDVKPYVQKVDHQLIEVDLPDEIKKIKDILEKIKEERIKRLIEWKVINYPRITKTQILKLQNDLMKKKKGSSFAAMSILAEVLKIDHALVLLETQCIYSLKKYVERLKEQQTKAVARLFNDVNFQKAIAEINRCYENDIEHSKMIKLKEIVAEVISKDKFAGIIVFAQYRDTISKIRDVLKEVKNASPVQFIGQAKKSGKGMSQKEQIQILNEFKMGFYNILIASQIGEEGLDIEETSAVIFYEPVPSEIRRVQRSGRTARTKPGKVITLITRNTRDEAYYWSAHHKEKQMKNILQNMQNQGTLGDFK